MSILASRDFHRFKAAGRYFVYLVPSAAVFMLDDASAAVLRELDAHPLPKAELSSRLADRFPAEEIEETIAELRRVQAIGDNDASDMAGPEAGGRDIERALAALAEDQRAALLLVVLEGLTYREVAEVQGVPIGTVMSRLARARMQIKAYLDGERPALRRVK